MHMPAACRYRRRASGGRRRSDGGRVAALEAFMRRSPRSSAGPRTDGQRLRPRAQSTSSINTRIDTRQTSVLHGTPHSSRLRARPTRARSLAHAAARLIVDGHVTLDGAVVVKPARQVNPAQALELVPSQGDDYVSRGARKLAGALDALGARGLAPLAGRTPMPGRGGVHQEASRTSCCGAAPRT